MVLRQAETEALAELLLTDAYEFVLAGWCQGSRALDEYGCPIEPASAFARRWSLLGALERAWQRSSQPPDVVLDAFHGAKRALTAACNELPQLWNDREGRRQSEVLDALAQAVQLIAAASPPRHDILLDLLEDLDYAAPRSRVPEAAPVAQADPRHEL